MPNEKEEFERSGGNVPHFQFVGVLACNCNSKKTVRIEACMQEINIDMTCEICGNIYEILVCKIKENK